MFRLWFAACLVFCVLMILLILPVGKPIGRASSHQQSVPTSVIAPIQQPIPATSTGGSEVYAGTGSSTGASSALIGTSVVYIVVPGDTLSTIAAAHHTTVAQLAALNGLSDPDVLYAGQRLIIPGTNVLLLSIGAIPAAQVTTTPYRVYTVQAGDTLWQLAQQWGTTTQTLMSLNGLPSNGAIQTGQQLYVP